MLRLFRQIRQHLLSDNKFSKYLLYAVGEILLVVIGILIALQINNWNESRKQEEQFRLALQQAYNSIDINTRHLSSFIKLNANVGHFIDLLLYHPDSVPDPTLPFMVFYIDQGLEAITTYKAPQNFQMTEAMNPDPNDLQQIQLAKEVTSFFKSQVWDAGSYKSLLSPFLFAAGIPTASVDLSQNNILNFEDVDTSLYTLQERAKIRSLVVSEEFKLRLRSLQASLVGDLDEDLSTTLADGLSVQRYIREYFPEVRLLFEDIGIIGTAIAGYEAASTPMKLTDPQKSIWEIQLTLQDGTVKFRSRDSWNQNWGGISFPKGDAQYYGQNIPVKKGRYRVVLNLSESTYAFLPLE